MTADIYSLAIRVDSTQVNQATGGLSQLERATQQAERAVNSIAGSTRTANAAMASMSGGVSGLSRDASQLNNSLNQLNNQLNSVTGNTRRAAESANAMRGAFGALGLGAVAKDILQTNIAFEQLQARMEATFGSAAKGREVMASVVQIARDTPQSIEEISKSFIMLKNFGIEPTVKVMTDLTNMVSKVGGGADALSGIIRQLGQAFAKGKLQAEDANIMIERGVPIYGLLQKALNKTTSEIADMMHNGELTRPVIEKLIDAMGSSSVGASTKMMETLGGKIEGLSSAWKSFEAALLNDQSEGIIKQIVTGWTQILDGFTAYMNKSVSAQIVDLNDKLASAMNRKSFITIGLEKAGVLDSPADISKQIGKLKQQRLSDFVATRDYDKNLKQETENQKATEKLVKSKAALLEFEKKYGDEKTKNAAKEKEALKEQAAAFGRELTAKEKLMIHDSIYAGSVSKAKTASHKAETAALREANREAKEQQRIFESTAAGRLISEVEELNKSYATGLMPTSEYNLRMQSLADSYNNAVYGAKDLKDAQKELNEALAGSARGQFESGYASLQKSKEFMTAKEYESKQSQLLDSYLSATGNKEEKKKESDDLTKAYENEVEALEKVRREINLNDTAAYEAAQRQKGFTDEQISKLLELREAVNMSKLWDDMGLSIRGLSSSFSSMFSQVLTQGKSFTSALQGMLKNTVTKISDSLMNFGMNSLMSGNWIAGIAGVVGSIGSGLLSGLFGDKEKDLRSPDTKISNSNSIQNVVKTLNDIHAKEYKELQGINDNFTLLTRNIDNTIARAVAWNGSFVPSTVGMTSSQAANGATKSALGGNSAAGIGVSGVTGAIAGAGAAIYGATSAASALGVSLGGAGTAAIGAIGAVAGLAGGLVLGGAIYGLGKLLGIGKTKYTAIGNGLVTQPAKLIESGIEDGFKAYNFSVVKATTKTWFGNKSKIFEVINGVNDEMSQAFGSIFGQLGTTLSDTFSTLGISNLTDYNLQNTVIPALKMTLTGKSDAEISDIISGVINTMTDKMATEIVGGLFEPFAKSGESMLETIYRLATQTAVVRANFHKVGIEVDATGMGAIALSDAIASIYESSIGAKDGLKQFTGAINDFYNAVLTQGEKVSMTIADYSAFVAANPQLGLSADASLVSGKQMMDAFTMASNAAQAAKDAAEPILNLGQAAKNAFAPETTNDLGSNNKAWVGAWQGVVNAPFSSMTPKDFKAGFWDIAKQWSQVQNEDGRFIAEIVRVAEANQAKIEQGTKEIAGLNITSLDQYTQQADAANESIGKTAKELKNITDQTGAFTVIINEFQKKFKDLDEVILASVTTNAATTKRARDKQLIELKEYDKQRIASNSLSTETKRLYAEYTKTTIEANDKTGYLTSTLQEVAWQAEDTAKSMNKFIDANKYVMDFSRGIKQWVENLRATQLGSPSTQIEAARRAFNEQLNLAKFAPDAETKRGALSGITGYADTFINAIKSFYGSSEEGQKQLQNVVDEVSNLEKGLSIQELQLGALQDIKDAIMDSAITIPKGISEESAKIYESLLSKAQIAGSEYKSLPTVENALKFDAFAKVVMTIDRQSQSQDAKFVDELIKSVIGEKGISAAIDVVINNATLTGSQKESVLNNLTAEFNKALEGFNGLEKVASEITRVNELWNGIKLDSTPVNDAGIAVKGLTNDLVGLNGEYDVVVVKAVSATQKVVEFGALDVAAKVGLNGVADVVAGFDQITASANAARDAMNALNMADAAQRQLAQTPTYSLENQAISLGYAGDYTDTAAMQALVDAKNNPLYPNGFGGNSSTVLTPISTLGGMSVASNDSNVDTAKTIEELKTIVRQQDAMIRVMQDGFSKLQAENKEQNENLNNLASSVRLQARA